MTEYQIHITQIEAQMPAWFVADQGSLIRPWCSENGEVLAEARWEVYCHWNDVPGQVRTEV
jgi:hypothetical protein